MSDPKLRASQLVTTFGPGAMVDLPDQAVIVGGLDHWRYDPARLPAIHEPRLAAKLAEFLGRADIALRAPPPASDQPGELRQGVDVWRFPEWFIVQEAVTLPNGHRRRRLVHANALEKGRFRDHDNRTKPVVPIRFVRACIRGHIGDIDWPVFVHGERGCARDLWVEERGTSGDLDEVFVICECGQSRAMSQTARPELRALGNCNGSRPWLGPGNREGCGQPNLLLIRSASNAYFPQLMSVISIPDHRSPVDDVVAALWDGFLSAVAEPAQLSMLRALPALAGRLEGIESNALWEAIQRRRSGGSEARSIKEVEFEALSGAGTESGEDRPQGDFFARALLQERWNRPWMAAVESVVLVHRLREVTAQVGFTRFESAGTDINGELDLGVETAPLALDATWLPAVENRGEGIFLRFRAEAIEHWARRDAVIERANQLLHGFNLWKAERPASGRLFPGMPYILLHSLSHLLISAISLECGYPASSLRERVYALQGRYGILIHTGSPGAEGTLGGLVQAGREIARHLRRAVEMAELCTNDPVCAQRRPSEHDHQPLNGAACHACLLISETSCEQRNDFLDRVCVASAVYGSGAGLFGGVPVWTED